MKANPKLRKWLNHSPRPAVIVCDEQRINAPRTTQGWAEVAETIEQLAPSRIVCMDLDGKVMRAKDFAFFFPEAAEEEEREPAAAADSSELVVFAKLISEAYANGSKGTQPLLDNAMSFIQQLSVRLSKSEEQNDRLRAANAKLAAELALERAQPEAPEGDGVVGSLMQGFLAAQQAEGSVTPIAKGKKP